MGTLIELPQYHFKRIPMNVYAYHEPIAGSGAVPIIDLWRSTWRKYGWNPILLGESDFKCLPFSDAVDYAAKRLPTVNNPVYERACYRRWLAVAGKGGGLMADYDVINLGFAPEDIPNYPGKLLILDKNSPALVYGELWDYMAVLDIILAYTPAPDEVVDGNPHVSDMTIVNKHRHLFDTQVICIEYKDLSDAKPKLIHFSTVGTAYNKRQCIEHYLKHETPIQKTVQTTNAPS